ncbi:TetR/AcrR family transcriptional regulator [Streptomyces xantholiticus]|uniref:TetR/AcrR family transcriptional regulator n=1 Tax=Streptomyces xantholiticus TaxID=68285 RepID=UPI001675E81A|nr:TetR/AcrR family transcriptional regulator [Streptomyces xantholiticus]GGW50593.1 TetR family transcriptional regulator [Streptomyces xantholiticus]
MATSRRTGATEAPSAPLRRRGPVLERAILEAALELLGTVGWSGFTMEGVAAGAQTGKAAVYRRWPSKEDLVADALEAGLPPLDQDADQGGVREDLFHVCRRVRDAMFSRTGVALRSVLHECDAVAAERFQGLIVNRVVEPSKELFRAVVRRGVSRGDVRPDAACELVLDVIPGLLMYRSKVCGSEWPDTDIAQMIDQVMVPLLRPHSCRPIDGGS